MMEYLDQYLVQILILEDAERKHAELSGSGKRARNDKGHFIADDESTPDVNEAYSFR